MKLGHRVWRRENIGKQQQRVRLRSCKWPSHGPGPGTALVGASRPVGFGHEEVIHQWPDGQELSTGCGSTRGLHLNRLSLCPVAAPSTQKGLVKTWGCQLPSLLGDGTVSHQPKRPSASKAMLGAPNGCVTNSTMDTTLTRGPL